MITSCQSNNKCKKYAVVKDITPPDSMYNNSVSVIQAISDSKWLLCAS